MNFNHLICNNCENEELEDSFLIFGLKNPPILSQSNKTDIHIKSILSTSDNNNSTNNLEIIEYPYNYNANNNDIEYIPDIVTPPSKLNINNKKNRNNDFDDFLEKLKPPKLFNEGKKKNIENKEDKEPELKINKIEAIQQNDKNENINNNNNINDNINDNFNNNNINDNINDNFNNDNKNKINKIINSLNIKNINNKKSINNDKKKSENSSSLIDNEDSLINHKVLLNNYYSNCNSALNNYNEKSLKEKKEKELTDKLKITEIEKDKLENNNLNKNIKLNSNINGIKVDYPIPDTINFYLKSFENKKFSNKKKTNLINIKSNIILKKEKSKTINDKTNTNINNNINSSKKLIKHNTNINFKKNEKNMLYNIKNSATGFQNYMNNQNNKTIDTNNRKSHNKINKNKKLIIKVKLNNKIKMNKKESFKKIKNFFINEKNENNDYIGLKTEKTNQNRLINLTKDRSRYLSNGFLNDLLLSKNNFNKRNTFSNFTEKKKSKISSSNLKRTYNETTINSSSNYTNYTNPFVNLYDNKKRNFYLKYKI